MGRVTIALAVLGLLAVPAMAEEKAPDASKAQQAKDDPNRIICEKQEVLGTRLGTKKVCMTAGEWKARRLDDRQTIDKQQTGIRSKSGG